MERCFLYRLFEISFAIAVLAIFTFPVMVALWIRKLITQRNIFVHEVIYGELGKKMDIYPFNLEGYWVRSLPLFLGVIRGKLSLTGVSIKRYTNEERVLGDAYLFYTKPGIFNLWFIRESSRIAYGGKQQVEWEYVFQREPLSDLLLILKTIPAILYSQKVVYYKNRISLFGMDFMNIRMPEAIEIIRISIFKKEPKSIFFINPDCANKLFKDREYYEVLQKADYIYPDGIGINIACKILKNPLIENINGTDLFPFLCQMCQENGFSIYLLGAKPGVAEKMKHNVEMNYPDLKIVGYRDGYFNLETESDQVIDAINKTGADMLLVAFGAPAQEKWIIQHHSQLTPTIQMGVGGLFDFYSGKIPRAPVWMREIGLEWVYRLIQEPRRMWRRYIIGNPLFLYRVMRWKMAEGEESIWK